MAAVESEPGRGRPRAGLRHGQGPVGPREADPAAGLSVTAALRNKLRSSRGGIGRRPGKQLVDEGVPQPSFLAFGRPASVTGEQPVNLGGHECVNDVCSFALAQLRS